MKRHIYFLLVLVLMTATRGMAQTAIPSGDEDHNVNPLIVALIVLGIAIITRLITVIQSRKQGNAI